MGRGEVQACSPDSGYTILYVPNRAGRRDRETGVAPAAIVACMTGATQLQENKRGQQRRISISSRTSARPNWRVNDNVQVRYRTGTRWYNARITAVGCGYSVFY